MRNNEKPTLFDIDDFVTIRDNLLLMARECMSECKK